MRTRASSRELCPVSSVCSSSSSRGLRSYILFEKYLYVTVFYMHEDFFDAYISLVPPAVRISVPVSTM